MQSVFLLHGFHTESNITCNWHTVHKFPVEDRAECLPSANHLYFHSIFDFQKESAMALFVNQVCRALSVCVPPSNFRLIIHTVKSPEPLLAQADQFLAQYGIGAMKWDTPFDTILANKKRKYLPRCLGGSSYLYRYRENVFTGICLCCSYCHCALRCRPGGITGREPPGSACATGGC